MFNIIDVYSKSNKNVASLKWRPCAMAPIAHPSETPLDLRL